MAQKILFIQSKTEPTCFKSVKQVLSESKDMELAEAANYAEATMIAQSDWSGLVILVVTGKDELTGAINFMTAQAPAIKKDKTVRTVVFSNLPGTKVQLVFTKLGNAEFLDFKVTGRALLHKIQRHMKIVKPAKKAGDENLSQSASETGEPTTDTSTAASYESRRGLRQKGRRRGEEEEETSAATSVQTLEPLTHAADYWLTQGEPEGKRIMGRWMTEMIGPGPSIGEWRPIKTEGSAATKGTGAFEWKVKDAANEFATPTGRWVFVGRQVEFAWRSNRWRFVGDKMSLMFYEGEQAVAKRFFSENANLLKIALNSEIAKARQDAIDASLVNDAHQSKRAEAVAKGEGEAAEYKTKRLGNGDDAEDEDDHGELRLGDDSNPDESSAEAANDGAESLALGNVDENGQPLAHKRRKKGDLHADGNLITEDEEETLDALDEDGNPVARAKQREEVDAEHLDLELKKDFDMQAEVTEGTDLNGTFASEEEKKAAADFRYQEEIRQSKELSATLDKEKEGKELSITLDPEHEGKEMSLDLGEEEERPDWGGDAKKDNLFNGGGITQGHGKTHITHDEEFATAEDAFKLVGLMTTLSGEKAEVIDTLDEQMVVRVEGGSFAKDQIAELEVLTENMNPPETLNARSKILRVDTESDTGAFIVQLELTPGAVEGWAKIMVAVENRQENILKFFKMAKGA